SIAILTLCACAVALPATAQDMMRHVDLNSPEMATAEITRAEVAAMAAAAMPGHPADFTGKKLSGLDLSGLDLSAAVFPAAPLHKNTLIRVNLDSAMLVTTTV